MTRGARAENPSPSTPLWVDVEQGWITAVEGGHCASSSPCVGLGCGHPLPSFPSQGKMSAVTPGFQRYEPLFLGGCERGGERQISRNTGLEQWAVGVFTPEKQLMLISPWNLS